VVAELAFGFVGVTVVPGGPEGSTPARNGEAKDVMSDNQNNHSKTSARLEAAKISLQTARISLNELDKLRAESRTALPTLQQLASLVGRAYQDAEVQAVLFPLGLHYRKREDVHEATSRAMGMRCRLDDNRIITTISLMGQEPAWSSWTGDLGEGLTTTTTRLDVQRRRGRPHHVEDVDGKTIDRYVTDDTALSFIYDNQVIREVRLTRSERP